MRTQNILQSVRARFLVIIHKIFGEFWGLYFFTKQCFSPIMSNSETNPPGEERCANEKHGGGNRQNGRRVQGNGITGAEPLCNGGSRGFLSALSRIWLETSKSKKVTLHDPLVIAYLVDPTLVTMENAPIRVVLEHGSLRGLTMDLRHPFRRREPLPEANARIAVAVDRDRACGMILNRIFADP